MIPGIVAARRAAGGGGGPTYATWDPTVGTDLTFTNGDRTVAASPGTRVSRATIALSGKMYFEVSYAPAGNGIGPGLATTAHTLTNYLGAAAAGAGYYMPAADVYIGGAVAYNGTNSATTPVTNGFAFEASTRKLWIRRHDSTWEGGGDPAAGTSPTLTLAAGTYFPSCTPGNGSNAMTINAGQAAFVLWTPSGGYTGVF